MLETRVSKRWRPSTDILMLLTSVVQASVSGDHSESWPMVHRLFVVGP